MLADRTFVRRLRIRATGGDHSALERQAGAFMAAADVRGSRVSAEAILVIRTFTDPKPRSLRLADRSPVAAATWEQAARAQIDEIADRAARPWRGAVPASAVAVLFADRADLLACLARDWCAGTLSRGWWWQTLFPRVSEAVAVLKAWREEPRSVPAALDQMVRSGHLAMFLGRLRPDEASPLAAQVELLFQVRGLAAAAHDVIARAGSETRTPDTALAAAPHLLAEPQPRADAARKRLAELIRRHVPEVSNVLAPIEARAWAAITLLVHRAPLHRVASIVRDLERAAIAETDQPVAVTTTHPRSEEHRATLAHHESTIAKADTAPTREDDAAPREPIVPVSFDVPPVAVTTIDGHSAVAPIAFDPPEALPELVVESDFAGAFYLVNVAIALGYYGDFTQPLARGLDLSIWQFLARAARRLVPPDQFDADPLPPLLARLDREDEPAGPEWEAWFDAHVPEMRERLTAALGIEPGQVGAFVSERHGRIRVTASQIEVAFELASLPIAIRLSGLDRNPGFVPAAGVSIAFVYD
jgi:hypothetical protein